MFHFKLCRVILSRAKAWRVEPEALLRDKELYRTGQICVEWYHCVASRYELSRFLSSHTESCRVLSRPDESYVQLYREITSCTEPDRFVSSRTSVYQGWKSRRSRMCSFTMSGRILPNRTDLCRVVLLGNESSRFTSSSNEAYHCRTDREKLRLILNIF